MAVVKATAVALIQSLAQELPHAVGLKKEEKKKKWSSQCGSMG